MASPGPERKRGRSPSPSRYSDSRRRSREPEDRDERERARKREKEHRRVERRRREREEDERSKAGFRASPPRRPASSSSSSLRATPPHLRTIDRSITPIAPAASSSSSAPASEVNTRPVPTGPSKAKEDWDRSDWEHYREGLTSKNGGRSSPPPPPSHSTEGLELCRNMASSGFYPFGENCRFYHPPPRTAIPTAAFKSVDELPKMTVVLPQGALCRNWEMTGSCVFGQDCRFTHGREERERLIEVAADKRQLCKDFLTKGCKRGPNCKFKHAAEETTHLRRDGEPSKTKDEFASFWESGPSDLVKTHDDDVKMEENEFSLDVANGRQHAANGDDEYSPLAPHASHAETPLGSSSVPAFVPLVLPKLPSLEELQEINRAVLLAAAPPPPPPPPSAPAAPAPGDTPSVPSLPKEKILRVLVQIQKLYQQGKTPENCPVMGQLLDLVRVFEDEHGPVEMHIDPSSILFNAATPPPVSAPAPSLPSSRIPSASTSAALFPSSTQPSSQPKTHRDSHAGPSTFSRRGTISSVGGSVDGRAEQRRSATPARLLPVKTEIDVVEMESPRRKSLSKTSPAPTPAVAFNEILEIFNLLTKHQTLTSSLSTEQVTLDKLRTSTSSGKDLYVQHTEKRLAKLKDEIDLLPVEIVSRIEKMKARGSSDAGLEGILSHVEELVKAREETEKENMTTRIRLEMMEEEVGKFAAVNNTTESNRVELEKIKTELAGTRSETAALRSEVGGLKEDLVKERQQNERLERETKELRSSNGRHSADSLPRTPPSEVLAGPEDILVGGQHQNASSSLTGLEQAMEEVAKQKAELLDLKKGILTVLSQLKSSDFTDDPTNGAGSPTSTSSNGGGATHGPGGSLFRGLFPSWQ